MKKSRANKGQFSVIAALLVSVILVTAVISAYTLVRHAPIQGSPKVLTAIGEMNADIKQILDFTVGYYGSILKVTGNSTYAQDLTTTYLSEGLVNIARSHPEWNPSFDLTSSDFSTCWFMPESFSAGNLSVAYSLESLGINGVKYETSSALEVTMLESDSGVAQIMVTRDNSEPELGLTKDNFYFYNYTDDSTWDLINPASIHISSNGVYNITLPSGIDADTYSVQVEDSRGLMVSAFYSPNSVASASKIPRYTYTFDWNATGMIDIFEALSTDSFTIELLQNGTLKWLGESLEVLPKANPIPPVCIKAFHVNATINDVSQEVPFQIEDWASDYMVPLGLSSNESIFSGTNMFVFLANNEISKITLWWDGNDTAVQTPYAWRNVYFTDDVTNPDNGQLSNGYLDLDVKIVGNPPRFEITSNVGGSTSTADFLRINGEAPIFWADTSYIIYNGIVRDIVQQEPEYSGGITSPSCPNFYTQVVLTLPANATYYTYSLRTIFVDSVQSRTIADLSAIQLSGLNGDPLTEDGTSGGYPDTSDVDGSFSDGSPSGWDHHWSQFSSFGWGAGVMFTNSSNENLYVFDDVISAETGAIVVDDWSNFIEVNPVELQQVTPFSSARDLTWYGAVVTFNDEPIHPDSGHDGLWVMVEHPPVVSMDEYEEEETEPPPPPPESPLEFPVSNDVSDVDSSPDKGSHSDFAAQKAGPDSTVDLLTEATEDNGIEIEDYVDNDASDVDVSEDVGSHSNFAAQQAGPDSSFDTLTEENTAAASGDTTLLDDGFEGWPWDEHWNDISSSWRESTYITHDWSASSAWASNGHEGAFTCDSLDASDASSITVEFWYFVSNTEYSDLQLQFYGSSGWTTIANLGTGYGWQYYSVVITDSQYFISDFQIRFVANLGGGGENVYVDDVLITKEVSTGDNYELDLEVQFTGVVDLMSNNELCIYAGTLGSEDLRVDYWSGSDWQNVATDLTANSWNNFTISLSSSTVTVRFSGGSESGDSSADQWQIDTVLVNSHGNGNAEEAVDNDTSDVDASGDVGSHSDFSAAQSGPDSVFDTLTEANVGADAVIKVEHVQFDFGAGGSTTSVTDVGDVANAFFRNNVARRTSAGPTGSSSHTNWNVFSAGAQLTDTNELTGYRATGKTATVRIRGEVWRYTGAVGGPNEFIVRWRGVVTIAPGSKTSSQAVSGISDRDKCVPFVQGVIGDINSRNDGNSVISHAHIDSSDNLIVERGEPGIEIDVYVVVVEFTGSNWNVGHALGSSFSTGANNVALFDGSDGTGNSFDVGNWHTAFIEASMSGDVSGNHALEDTGFVIEPQSGSTSGVTITFDGTAGLGGSEVFVHVIQNDNIYVNRYTDSQSIPTSDNHAVSGLTSLDESALEWYVYTDGGGTAYARGATGAYLTSTTNVAEWTHRTGNAGTYRFGVIDLSGLVDTNHELDLEMQWTDVPYTLPNEYLAIYGGTMGDEDLAVDVWTGSGWETVFSDLSSGWNNASITDWLTGSTFTIRFRGGTEVDDSSLDTWQIDVALIHVWSEADDNYELDLEVQWTDVEFDKENEELCIYAGALSAENLRVDVWTGSGWDTVISALDANDWNNVTVSSYVTSSTFTIRFVGTTETDDTTQDYWAIDVTLLRCWDSS